MLLEALVALLVLAFGMLGVAALQARSLRATEDSRQRVEVASQVETLLATLRTGDTRALADQYDSRGTGAGYRAFRTEVRRRLGAAWIADPEVQFDDARAPSAGSTYVTVRVEWMMAGEQRTHRHVASAVVGRNP